jgi:uncharacterized SAM-dependent methyltransferase
MVADINDYIFKELIKRGYSLQGHTRVWNIADSKLWYLTPKQAQAYLDLENSKTYNEELFKAELNLLVKNMPEIAEKVLQGSAINIIDIGCGDGKKAVIPLNVLHNKVKLRYCPIDISSYMVTKALKNIKDLEKGEVVNFRWNISDFDNIENIASLLRDAEYRQNCFLFLGDTISNFEIHEVLYEIVEAMETGTDYLLIGLTLSNKKPEELIKPYKNAMNDKFLCLILDQLGFDRKDVEFGVRYVNSRVENFYTIKRDIQLTFGDKTVHFEKGDQILVAISYRHNENELKKFMDLYFGDYKFYFDKDKNRALILCKK